MSYKSVAFLFALASLSVPAQYQPHTPSAPLDRSFGSDGRVTTGFGLGIPAFASAVIIQPDAKILTAGRAGTRYALARYNSDGSTDTSFGTDGKVVTQFFGYGDQAYAVLVQPDGRIVAAGSTFRDTEGEFALARYNGDGSLDSSFGVDGRVNTGFVTQWAAVHSIALLPNEKIVAAGYVISPHSIEGGRDFALARYHKDGRLDASFGIEGRLTTDFFGGEDGARAIIVLPDRKILALGYANRRGENKGIFAAVRYNQDGSLDSSFGNNGKFTNDFLGRGGRANAAVLQPDGKIVLAGLVRAGNYSDFGLMRLNPDGTLDSTFGEGGTVLIDFLNETIEYANAIAVQRNGKIVVAGLVLTETNGSDFAIARVTSNGALDVSFGDGGKTTIDFFNLIDAVHGIAIQDSGKIVVAGSAQRTVHEGDFGLARFDSSRPIIASASTGGKRLIISGTGFEEDAKILINGKAQKTATDSQNPTTTLINKKAGRKIELGDKLRVMNSDGALSPEFTFTGLELRTSPRF
jgi:uncharacterized delta-60 repeat protein